ncbi:MAG: oligopeptide:H+ symporter [Gammaproteobacteria bacterium]
MESMLTTTATATSLGRPFWVVWAIEFWERFGYYGVQAIIALYFVNQLGYSEAGSFYIFGSFSAFSYGFVWVGGWLGDKYLGTKCTMILGAFILMLAYVGLAFATYHTVFYALTGIIIGSALFKANPASLIAKMFTRNNTALDGAMTFYYMAVNLGSMFSMMITPIVAVKYGWSYAFMICAIGLLVGLCNYGWYRHLLMNIGSPLDMLPINYKRVAVTLIGSALAILAIAQLLTHTMICNWIVYTVVTGAFLYFLKIAFSLSGLERIRMLVAFVLILEGVLFFVLYNQSPTSLTFFAVNNINNHFLGWSIPPAEYQVLNAIVIVIMSPILVKVYRHYPATHVTKFCIGMSLCAVAFLVLAIPQYTATNGLASPWWMVLTYFLQSTGELLISGLGLAMVAALCPLNISGFVMGIWLLTNMLAGPIGAWVGAMTTTETANGHLSAIASIALYGSVFAKLGAFTGAIALLMWISRPALNRLLKGTPTLVP